MRKERLLYFLLGILFLIYVMVEYYKPKPLNWTVTYAQTDKNPYGGYIFYDRLDDVFTNKSLSFSTLYESKDSTGHLIILSSRFNASDADMEALFHILDQGRSIMISAQRFSGNFLDSLGLAMHLRSASAFVEDSVMIKLKNESFYYPADVISSWFTAELPEEWHVLSTATQEENPVLIQRDFGKAKLILSSTPLAFTNYGFLYGDNYRYISAAIQLMPYEHITYSRFYHSGKSEPPTPLRYVLSQAPLKWALYLTLLLLVLYLVIGSRRVQRVIPVLDPVKNTTAQFIQTIGGLFFRERNHKNAANKLIRHFQKSLTQKYYIRNFNEESFPPLSAKAGVPIDAVIQTFDLIQSIKQANKVTDQHLKQLYEKINLFKIH